MPGDVVAKVEAAAEAFGLSRDEAVELILRSTLQPPDEGAANLRRRYETPGSTTTPADIAQALKATELDLPVVGVRLGSRRPSDDDVLQRDHVGADLTDQPGEVWQAARGLWKISAKPTILVAYRLGWPLAMYRVAGWEQDTETRRRWATGGIVLSGDRRVDADTGADCGELTAVDSQLSEIIMGRALVIPPGSANPIIWLNSR